MRLLISDKKQIESLAKVIFDNKIRLANLNNLKTMPEFKCVLDLFSMYYLGCHDYYSYSKNQKICSMFSKYISEAEGYEDKLNIYTRTIARKRNKYLRNVSIEKELCILNMNEMPDNIVEYIVELVTLENTNNQIKDNDLSIIINSSDLYFHVNCDSLFKDNRLPAFISKIEKELNRLNAAVVNTLEYFKTAGFRSNTTTSSIDTMDVLTKNYIGVLLDYISQMLELKGLQKNDASILIRAAKKIKKIFFKARRISSIRELHYVYTDLIYYIKAYKVMNETTAVNVKKNVFSIYRLLKRISENYIDEYSLHVLLKAKDMYRYVVDKLFVPILNEKDHKQKTSCKDLFYIGLQDGKSPELILSSFFMPGKYHPSRFRNLWGDVKFNKNKMHLDKRMEMLLFFQEYVSDNALPSLLKVKLETQKLCVDSLNNHNFNTCYQLNAKKVDKRSSLPQPKSSHIRMYDGILMEYLAKQKDERRELRKISPNI